MFQISVRFPYIIRLLRDIKIEHSLMLGCHYTKNQFKIFLKISNLIKNT